MYIVTTKNSQGERFPLRGTVWAFSMDRAQRFETVEQAQAALLKAKQFMKAATFKKAVIEQVD
jgi:bisphosphoglycerate-independent phosphoglycerate mutase (AlkP superfamily)